MKEKSSALSSFQILFQDEDETLSANGRADDRSEESIIFARIAERAVVNGIGKMTNNAPNRFQVTVKSGSDAERCKFSKT